MDTRLRDLKCAPPPAPSRLLPYAVRTLHILYACAIVWVLRPCTHRLDDPAALLALVIGIPLVVDNLRLSLAWGTRWASYVCFFAHEVLTPWGLLYLPLLFDEDVPVTDRRIFWGTVITASAFFAWQGLTRFAGYAGQWKMEASLGGVTVCRPANASHAALIPIFMQVIGVVACAGYVAWTRELPARHPVAVLCYAQLVVFIGNGAIGPHKVLMGLFGNGFEVLWLWSLVQATLSFY